MNALVLCHRRSLTFLFFFCLSAAAWGQPKAGFSATPVSGCSPLVVYFTDQSSGHPTQWKWDLGNGVISHLRNPSATYFNPGNYTIKLVVSNTQGSDSVVKTKFITVHANPVVEFHFSKDEGCFPLPVEFTDNSTPGSGTLASWQWDFGDGTVSTGQNPLHTFSAAGRFPVTLRVTNSSGCVKSATQTDAINISGGVKAGFSSTDPGVCAAPASVQFTNNSSGPGPLQFQWSFGDSAISQAINPVHNYRKNGTYSVRLIATSPLGCADTITKPELFRIGTAKADFSSSPSVCINENVLFTNTTQPSPQRAEWAFGDGSGSTALHSSHRFTNAGIYTVRLVSYFGACSDTVTRQVTVSAKPSAQFTAAQKSFCGLPMQVAFSSAASGNHTYQWDFGDSTTSDLANPVHAYQNEGSFTVRLIVTNESGCSDTLVKKDAIKIETPRIELKGLPANGCTPVAISPFAVITGGQSIKTYQWDFGDGFISNSAYPSHAYTNTGTYTVKLIALTSGGCVDTIVYPNAVRVGEKPKAGFVSEPPIACASETISFRDKSTGAADQWLWVFNDGGFSTAQHPRHQFSDTGWQNVTLVVYNNTCADTVTVPNTVYINPPVSLFSVTNDCENQLVKPFKDLSLGAETWFWDFGDGQTSTEQHPVHTYSGTGRYAVKLTVTNGNCTHQSVQTVVVINEKAAFSTTDTALCRNGIATFTANGLTAGNITNWIWYFGDGTMGSDAGSTSHAYPQGGNYTITLTTLDVLGCKSSTSRSISVFGPMAAFSTSASASCLKDNLVGFEDRSTTDGQHPLTRWIWNFGDGDVDSAAAAAVQHSYNDAGKYKAGLTVFDAFGCSDSTTALTPVVIAQPQAAFNATDTITCTGKPVSFTNGSQAVSPSFQWTFGDGKGSAEINPTHAYGATGVYSVKLVVTDQYGCKDSLTKPDFVAISYPKVSFTLSDTIGTCPPLLVHFNHTSQNASTITWDFGDGASSKLDTPSHFYSVPGTFYAKLVATGPGGCTDTAQQKIVVKGPSGTLSYNPLTGCNPLTVTFRATTKNNASFIWDFSDGTTAASGNDTVSHTYVTAGEFVPKIILTDAAGCTVPIEGKDTIRVYGVRTDFSLSNTLLCDKGTVQLENHTVSNDVIKNYRWDFGDGNNSADVQPSHQYTAPGAYTVQLLVTTQNGCTDKKIMRDTVKVLASPVVKIEGDSASCAPAMFMFTGRVISGDAAQLSWKWNMGNGQTDETPTPAAQVYTGDGSYTVSAVATDQHGCSSMATKSLAVYPVPQTNAGTDQWICRGSFYQLKASGAEQYQWKGVASLSCTDCDSPLAAPTDSTQYIVTGSNRFGCSSTDSVIIRVHQPFTLTVGRGDTICAGKTVNLQASGAEQYLWTPSAGVKNTAAGQTAATPQTSTLYKVVARDHAGCFTDTGSVYIKVWPLPTVQTADEQVLSIGNTLTLKPAFSADVTSYQWSNAQTLSCATCPAPVAKPKTETTYGIEVRNEGGCVASDAVTIRVICNDGNLFIPNTFSPNGDGTNDRFYPRGTGISLIKSLKVFNRWGELVFGRENFQVNDAAAGWDGSFKGQSLIPDVYIYTCDVVCMNNEVLSYKGDITLLR